MCKQTTEYNELQTAEKDGELLQTNHWIVTSNIQTAQYGVLHANSNVQVKPNFKRTNQPLIVMDFKHNNIRPHIKLPNMKHKTDQKRCTLNVQTDHWIFKLQSYKYVI